MSAFQYVRNWIEDRKAAREERLTPPRRLIDLVGGGDFHSVGQEFNRHYRELGGLAPHFKVLDVGCGCGRMAVPLLDYLTDEGEFQGIDIVPAAIDWCTKNITSKRPNFRFQIADIYNKCYNPHGTQKARDYRFPFENERFDFVSLSSVFTHMLSPDMEHYVGEISRVLKPGGKCMASFFLLNEESRKLIASGNSSRNLVHPRENCMVEDATMPEGAVGFDEAFVRACFEDRNLPVSRFFYGFWCDREHSLSYQDIVLARRR